MRGRCLSIPSEPRDRPGEDANLRHEDEASRPGSGPAYSFRGVHGFPSCFHWSGPWRLSPRTRVTEDAERVLEEGGDRAAGPGKPESRKAEKEEGPRSKSRAFGKNPGSVLLSHRVAPAVPSALESLTSVFGMGTGVASPELPPGKTNRSTSCAECACRSISPQAVVWSCSRTIRSQTAFVDRVIDLTPISRHATSRLRDSCVPRADLLCQEHFDPTVPDEGTALLNIGGQASRPISTG